MANFAQNRAGKGASVLLAYSHFLKSLELSHGSIAFFPHGNKHLAVLEGCS